MAVNNLFLLPVGRCGVAAWMLNTELQGTEAGQPLVSLPVWTYLIDTTDGPILVDSGMPDECIDRPNLFADPDAAPGRPPEIEPRMSAADSVTSVLQRAGHYPSDLACLVSTHWHFDHAGGNRHFTDTEVIVQRTEYDAWFGTGTEAGETDEAFWVPRDLNYQLVSGDKELVPGVHLIFTPGHSPGHQSLLVRTKNSGNVLLTIDAAYTRANYEHGVPFTVADEAKAVASIRKLKEIAAAENAFVFFGHETGQESDVRKFPASY